ncbi:MAG TPA: kelch repeat-containing protein [Methylomirabilota bacterium]|nr:kelch repeat-containing protein [Methylomirabilota bacterium]
MKRLAVAVAGVPAIPLLVIGALLLVVGLLSAGAGGFGGAMGGAFVLFGFLMLLGGAALLALARAVSTDRVAPAIGLGIVGVSVVAAVIGFKVLVPAEPDYCRGGEPGVGTDGWSTTGSMSTGRVPAAALLADGRVLVAGGFAGTACGDSNSAELYDPTTGSWKLTGRALVAHGALDAVVNLADGRVLVVGTSDSSGAMAVEIYDPSRGTWAPAAGMGATRLGGMAVGLDDGRVLVAGGTGASNPPVGTTSSEIYDPTTDLWTPSGDMAQARAFTCAAVRLLDGRVLVAGGLSARGPLKSAEIYDPATGTWSSTGDMIAPLDQGTGILLHDGRVLVLTGSRPQVYDPALGAWAEIAVGTGASYAAAVVLADGSVLLAGGFVDGMSAERFNPTTGTRTPAGRMGTVRRGAVAILLADGRALIVGGFGSVNDVGVTLSSTELYDPGAVLDRLDLAPGA